MIYSHKLILLCLLILLLPATSLAADIQFTIQGVSGDILTNIKNRLEIEKKSLGSQPTPDDLAHFYKNTPEIIKNAITPYGYFTPSIQSKLSRGPETWTATYTIRLGDPVLVDRIDLDISGPGSNNSALRRFINNFPIKRNRVFLATAYNDAKNTFLDIANNKGFIKADFADSRVLVNTDTHKAVIIMHMDTHSRYYIGQLIFNKSPYRESFLQRFNIFKHNTPFSSQRLIDYQQQMNQTNYFNQVIVVPDLQHDAPDRRIPVHVSVTTPKAHRYTAGIGYGTFTGPRMTAGVSFRRLTDTGQSMDAQVKLSSVLSGLALKYYIPGSNPLYDQWLLGANYQSFNPKNGQSNSRSIMGGYLYKSDRWQRSLNLNYLLERYSITTNNIPATNSNVLYPSLNISYVKADNLVSPNFGKSLNLTLQGASENVLSSTSFIQGEVKGKYFYTPVSFAHIIFRADIGYTVVHDINELPLSLRYFAGGITSIRGYPDSSIGPGRYLEVASIEYRNHVTENWDAAFFYDTGIATNHIGDPLNKGIGVGAVYESIVGPVKLYLARAISKHNRPYQVEFSLGPEF